MKLRGREGLTKLNLSLISADDPTSRPAIDNAIYDTELFSSLGDQSAQASQAC